METSLYDFTVLNTMGKSTLLSDYRNKTLLIVNVASQCGFTKQYSGLESLYKAYKEKGFEILAFPCNQFGHQEPGTDEEITQFCEREFQITFPVFSKINVNGQNADPLYQFLKSQKPGLLKTGAIKWNFTKFLIDRNGIVVKRYAPSTEPQQIKTDVEALLKNIS